MKQYKITFSIWTGFMDLNWRTSAIIMFAESADDMESVFTAMFPKAEINSIEYINE